MTLFFLSPLLPTGVDNTSSAWHNSDIAVGQGRVDTPEEACIEDGGEIPMKFEYIYLKLEDDCHMLTSILLG